MMHTVLIHVSTMFDRYDNDFCKHQRIRDHDKHEVELPRLLMDKALEKIERKKVRHKQTDASLFSLHQEFH